jgi:hypothetical protein
MTERTAYQQPELMTKWGTRFYGEAQTATGDIWWYEERMSGGSIKRHALLPVHPVATDVARGRVGASLVSPGCPTYRARPGTNRE